MKTRIANIRAGKNVSIAEAVTRVSTFIESGATGGEDDSPRYPGKTEYKDGIVVKCRQDGAGLALRVDRSADECGEKASA